MPLLDIVCDPLGNLTAGYGGKIVNYDPNAPRYHEVDLSCWYETLPDDGCTYHRINPSKERR